jgi:3-methyladenine DNA glycosylase AlkD
MLLIIIAWLNQTVARCRLFAYLSCTKGNNLMTVADIMTQLAELAQPSIKKVLLKHGIPEPLLGVKVEELKKIAKKIKGGHELSLQLYDTGVYDAMYLAGLVAEPQKMTPNDLQHWAETANSPTLREYTVGWVAAESKYGMDKATAWISADNTDLQSIGWSTLASLVTITPDDQLPLDELTVHMRGLTASIHSSADRVKLAMNGFVIACGIHVASLNTFAKEIAKEIGIVEADMGDTSCKIPLALAYIEKAESRGPIGKKKKSARCL